MRSIELIALLDDTLRTVRCSSDPVASFRRVLFRVLFSDQISLKVPNRFPNLSAYSYQRPYPNRFKSRHWVVIPKFPRKGTHIFGSALICGAIIQLKDGLA